MEHAEATPATESERPIGGSRSEAERDAVFGGCRGAGAPLTMSRFARFLRPFPIREPGRVLFSIVASLFAIGIGVVLRKNGPQPPSPIEGAIATTATAEAKTAAPIRDERAVAPPPSAETSIQSAVVPVAPATKPQAQLPRGGRQIFPQHRLVGFCGTPGASKLGRLRNNLPRIAKQIDTLGDEYATVEGDRKTLPVFELIAVIAQGERGADGKSRRRVPDKVVEEYLDAARADRAILLLNIQPGHS